MRRVSTHLTITFAALLGVLALWCTTAHADASNPVQPEGMGGANQALEAPPQDGVRPDVQGTALPTAAPTFEQAAPPVELAPAGVPGAPVAQVAEIEQRVLGPARASAVDRRAQPGASGAPAGGSAGSGMFAGGWTRTGLALGAVLALIIGLKLIMQRMTGRFGGLAGQFGAGGRSPSGVLEVLARYPVARGHSLVLLRMDQRVLLLGQSSQGFRTLTELTSPEEVASILMKTRDEEGSSMAARFNALLQEMERDPAMVADHDPGEAGPRSVRAARRESGVLDQPGGQDPLDRSQRHGRGGRLGGGGLIA